jgi:hypothetical protein
VVKKCSAIALGLPHPALDSLRGELATLSHSPD